VNWRAIGCGVLAAAIFVGIGLLGMSMAFSRFDGCPPLLRWADRRYEASGSPAEAPRFETPGAPVALGSTFLGLTTRAVFGPPGSSRSTAAADRPNQIALDCGDGSYQTYFLAQILVPPSTDAAVSAP
jgi:hypothetical protein